MKKQLLFISSAFVCLVGTLAAQPTLTATGINPIVGDVVIMNSGSYASPGSAGANQTWNLTAIGTGTGQTTNMVTPSTTPSGSSFATTNVCGSVGSGYYSYYATSASAWQNGGVVSPNGVVPYSNKEDLLRFPFNYTNTYTDAFAATWVSNGYTTYRSGNVTVTADGYGTVILPNGTYSNVMRVHFHEVYQDSTDFGGFPYVIEYDNDEYMWYLNGNRTPIAAVYTILVNGSASTVGLYKSSIAVGIDENTDDDNFIALFPSPASSEVTIRTRGIQDVITIDISSISGSGVLSLEPAAAMITTDEYKLDLTNLTSGIYFVQLTNKEGIIARKKLVVTK